MSRLKITLVKSTNSANKTQVANVRALGLHRIGQTIEHDDTGTIRGMVKRVAHLVSCEEIQGGNPS